MMPWRKGIALLLAMAIVAIIESVTRGGREFSFHRWRLFGWLFVVVFVALYVLLGAKGDE
jgi:hypothetical protein